MSYERIFRSVSSGWITFITNTITVNTCLGAANIQLVLTQDPSYKAENVSIQVDYSHHDNKSLGELLMRVGQYLQSLTYNEWRQMRDEQTTKKAERTKREGPSEPN